MKLVVFVVLYIFSLFAYSEEARSQDECEKVALDTYSAYRRVLLADKYDLTAVRIFLSEEAISNISEGKHEQFFASLRISEAKILKIEAYSVQCNHPEDIYLKFKTRNFNEDYNRRSVILRKNKGKYIIVDTSDDVASTNFDKNTKYLSLK